MLEYPEFNSALSKLGNMNDGKNNERYGQEFEMNSGIRANHGICTDCTPNQPILRTTYSQMTMLLGYIYDNYKHSVRRFNKGI